MKTNKQYYFKVIYTTAKYKNGGMGMNKIELDRPEYECPKFFVIHDSKNTAIDRLIEKLKAMKDD